MEEDYEERTCRWCDALGHDYEDDAYCPAGKPAGWFDPVYDIDPDVPPFGSFGWVEEQDGPVTTEVWW